MYLRINGHVCTFSIVQAKAQAEALNVESLSGIHGPPGPRSTLDITTSPSIGLSMLLLPHTIIHALPA